MRYCCESSPTESSATETSPTESSPTESSPTSHRRISHHDRHLQGYVEGAPDAEGHGPDLGGVAHAAVDDNARPPVLHPCARAPAQSMSAVHAVRRRPHPSATARWVARRHRRGRDGQPKPHGAGSRRPAPDWAGCGCARRLRRCCRRAWRSAGNRRRPRRAPAPVQAPRRPCAPGGAGVALGRTADWPSGAPIRCNRSASSGANSC